jgi:hypothetical protein
MSMLMEFEITWIDRSLVICRTSGVASIEGYRAMMQALTSQPQFRPGVDLIVDHTSVDASALTAVEIEQVAGFRVHFTGTTAGRVAGVIGLDSPMRYGLARIFSAYIEAGGAPRSSCSRRLTRRWLGYAKWISRFRQSCQVRMCKLRRRKTASAASAG